MFTEIMETALALGREQTVHGKPADYIPELGKADASQMGIAVFLRDGRRFCYGDTKQRFTIQSISKVITLAIALERKGKDYVFGKVGTEPSGDAFNSFIRLDTTSPHPSNPMINSGAIATASCISSEITFEEMLAHTRKLCMDDAIVLDEAVYASEASNSSRNRSIAYLLDSKGVITSDVETCLDFYIRMCSMSVTAESLAGLGLVLANNGIHPHTGERLLSPEVVRITRTIMLTCGMYDGSGEFAVRVGIPSKSGVGGGILATAMDICGIGLFGPALDDKGNSVGGSAALEYLSKKLGLHIFASRLPYEFY